MNNVLSEMKNNKCPLVAVCSLTGTIILIIVILLCIPMTIPKLLGYVPYTVISGSMEPAIATGSLVYVKGLEPEVVAAEDVIAYYGGRDRDAVITHRVVANRTGEKQFITKGDANPANDMTPVAYGNFLGRVEYSIPKMGYLAQFMTEREGKLALAGVIGLAVVLHLLAMVLNNGGVSSGSPREGKSKKNEEKEEKKE